MPPKVRGSAKVTRRDGKSGAQPGRLERLGLESADALRQGEQQADRLREQAAKSGGQSIAGVDRYEVAVAQQLSGVHA